MVVPPDMLGDPFGSHRVLEPSGALPQPAWRLDNDPGRRFETEIHVAVETLNIDAASFRQLEAASGGNDERIAELVRKTVEERGKQHNPVTGSGGMLIGRVTWVGKEAAARGYSMGDRVATLASLSLTPLALGEVRAVRRTSAQIDVEGTAIVFLSAPLVRLPADLPERLALAVCDVAGAAPQVDRHTGPGDRVVVLGAGGKSGLLSCAAARRRVGAEEWWSASRPPKTTPPTWKGSLSAPLSFASMPAGRSPFATPCSRRPRESKPTS